ncbi:MAG: MBL fold metallo-hydrolase [Treponema sp.]|jgi:glyoxylase-like metal-dependent hydrolase (beta-lactamase superfamily II)|nr:MBL fold metallo-hydrolase [Treponema sp.]
MQLYFHTTSPGARNSYILGSDLPDKTAVIIDPALIDQTLVNIIEDNSYTLAGVLITHDHSNHVLGLRTLERIYKTEVYAVNPFLRGYKTNMVRDGEKFSIGEFEIEVFSVPGHAFDAVIYKVDRLLFTGDALSAGLTGKTSSSYGDKVQVTALYSKILTLQGDYIVLPGHGPPSSIEAERRFNAGIQSYEHNKVRKPALTLVFE